MKRKKSLFVTALLASSLIFTACASEPDENGGNNNQSPDNNAGNSGESAGGDLRIGVVSDPVSLDPHGANENVSNSINNTIYDGLVYQDENMEIQPALAESLEQIEDTVWEAKIREGVSFHDGSELNAEVVKMSLDRVRDEEVASPVGFLFGMITEVSVVDEYTVHIETEFPFAPLPAHLAHTGGSIVSPELVEASYEALENGENPFSVVNESPAGTGYFQFDEHVSGEYVRLVKNEDYWSEEEAGVNSVTFNVIPEDLTRIGELETGGIHISYPVNPSDVERVENADGTSIQQVSSSRMEYLGFNTEVEPFDDPRVRQALHMAINKEDIVNGVLNYLGTVAHGPLAPDVLGYSEDIDYIEHNLEEARELLAEAGYPDGFEATLLTDDERQRQDIAQLVQHQLSEIGVEVDIDMTEFGTYLERAQQGETEMFLGSWGTVTMDGDYGLYAVFHSDNKGVPGNRSFIENERIDELLDQARQETDPDTRLDLYEEVQNELAEESPYAYLFFPDLNAGVRDEVEGFWQYPSGFYFLRDVTLND
ncbi:glutathione ABC transporter substrate-binding protein [Evansella sp. LMS18]|uniref:glutathione ABC transporter substrate-binding protein n=1 Tax=Evansella sp. LMS18 TaxID=2924033 RepID=UPI0020D01EF6|nr:glutathione ABC transporter substrate-binding protein [Evansella sp. LMS18]UTR10606.1 glutathione ABC transporter substrate-binding protein [Evansella sp. LMS18]